jgi:hypothetical protein
VGRALLVADQHVADGVIEEGVVGGQDGAAGVAEDGIHPFLDQAFPEDLSTGADHEDLLVAVLVAITLWLPSTFGWRR